MRPQPLISVTDVPRSSRWYQELLGCDSGHGGDEYERLLHDGALVLQLHRFEVGHHHGRIGDPSSRPYGNGVAVWFETDDFDEAVRRAEALHADVVRPPAPQPAGWPRRAGASRALATRSGRLPRGARQPRRRVPVAGSARVAWRGGTRSPNGLCSVRSGSSARSRRLRFRLKPAKGWFPPQAAQVEALCKRQIAAERSTMCGPSFAERSELLAAADCSTCWPLLSTSNVSRDAPP